VVYVQYFRRDLLLKLASQSKNANKITKIPLVNFKVV